MKTSGDLSEIDRETVFQLEEGEKEVDTDDGLPKERKAMAYTCLAHDWYDMDMEEEGNRLLVKANRVCPGYFKGPVIQHQKENEVFDLIINRITIKLLALFAGIKQ